MQILTVAFSPDYEELAEKIIDISLEKDQSISRTIRDMLCEYNHFTPNRERLIRTRNRTKKSDI